VCAYFAGASHSVESRALNGAKGVCNVKQALQNMNAGRTRTPIGCDGVIVPPAQFQAEDHVLDPPRYNCGDAWFYQERDVISGNGFAQWKQLLFARFHDDVLQHHSEALLAAVQSLRNAKLLPDLSVLGAPLVSGPLDRVDIPGDIR